MELLSDMILSASGWRMVFAMSGDENSMERQLSERGSLVCTAVSLAFAGSFGLKPGDRILLARDSRPTGQALCGIAYRTLTHLGFDVRYAGVCSAPEVMAQSMYDSYGAFFYVSASHNPAGHNGFKFGRSGGVFGQNEIAPAIALLREIASDEDALLRIAQQCTGPDPEPDSELKKRCLEHYSSFILKTACPDGNVDALVARMEKQGTGICADLNGSARCVSVDRELLGRMGFKTAFINDRVGEIAHGIIPEGQNLDCCRALLEKEHAGDPSFVLGYMPDNDGDRGNVVYIDSSGRAKVIPSQEVFALCVKSTLEYHRSLGTENLAVAVNGPTSMRIDRIAESCGARVFRAEVGEANVVNLADSLRSLGCNVPILGEGSNGGNITYPARVRDPMNTLLCLARILEKQSIQQALEGLPAFVTTPVTDPAAVLHLKTRDYRSLKQAYERAFEGQFREKAGYLSRFGICSWKEFQTEGIKERCEAGNGNTGGLRICFYPNGGDAAIAYIWMRPSGTEPLFRVLADVDASITGEKARELHDFLIHWQREMILKAQENPGIS